jgi:glycosyltransferase involved in cell wall biosynthesis
MRVVHVPFGFRPDPVGGTEVYVETLAREQLRLGLEVLIAAPGPRTEQYEDNGLPVYRFGTSVADVRDLYGAGDPRASREFGRLLDAEQPDIVHLHAFTSGVSLRLAREARRRGLRVVFTYHTPTVSCPRGTLLHWGRAVCDGRLDVHTCARCVLHGVGAGKPASALLGGLPPDAGRLIGRIGLSGGVWTALRMTELIELRQAAFLSLMREVDHTVVVCGWARDLLLRNGVPADKITVSRHGLAQRSVRHSAPCVGRPPTLRPLRVAFVGRLHPSKGVDLLVNAVRGLPGAPLELHLYGVAQGQAGVACQANLEQLAAGDDRILFASPMPNEDVVERLQDYDVVAVPSRVLETGPLVVLEAFAAGVPVVGSGLGGIAELVQHDVNGLLVPADSLEGWRRAFRRLLDEPELLTRLRAGVRPPRSMDAVARDMEAVYVANTRLAAAS